MDYYLKGEAKIMTNYTSFTDTVAIIIIMILLACAIIDMALPMLYEKSNNDFYFPEAVEFDITKDYN